jgi:predicted transposase YdaD
VKVAPKEDKAVMVDMLESLVGMQRAEELMGTLSEEYFEQGRMEGRVEGRVEGLAMGRAEGVLRILAVRRVSVDGKARQRILSCTDLDTLALWLERAGTATHVSEVLDGLSQ